MAPKKVAKKRASAKKAAKKRAQTSAVRLGTLPSPIGAPETQTAQRFLDAAAQSVRSALSALNTTRDLRRSANGHLPRGRLTDGEEDLLRAAVVFAGAGLDSTLKQLIRDALPSVTEANDDAATEFQDFTEDFLSEGDIGVNPRRLSAVLLDRDRSPWDALIEQYVRSLTGDSLQSAQQVGAVCTALGITDREFRKRIKVGSDLDQMFRARNQMIHELDLLRGQEAGGNRSKRSRTIEQTVGFAREALSVAQEIVNRTAEGLGPADLTSSASR